MTAYFALRKAIEKLSKSQVKNKFLSKASKMKSKPTG